jgi:hypothetical protein
MQQQLATQITIFQPPTNWLDTEGATHGYLIIRWLLSKEATLPICKVVPFENQKPIGSYLDHILEILRTTKISLLKIMYTSRDPPLVSSCFEQGLSKSVSV